MKRARIMKKCLITGATGLMGRHVVGFLRDNWEVYALVRKWEDSSSRRTHYVKCDLADEWRTDRLPTTVDSVIHLAQSEHFREFPMHAERIFKVNVVSTLHLLEYSRHARVKTFVLASSGGIYGHGDEGFREDQPISQKTILDFISAPNSAQKYWRRTILIS
jgi:nucleoside-diphosphate-sugar epimerase